MIRASTREKGSNGAQVEVEKTDSELCTTVLSLFCCLPKASRRFSGVFLTEAWRDSYDKKAGSHESTGVKTPTQLVFDVHLAWFLRSNYVFDFLHANCTGRRWCVRVIVRGTSTSSFRNVWHWQAASFWQTLFRAWSLVWGPASSTLSAKFASDVAEGVQIPLA